MTALSDLVRSASHARPVDDVPAPARGLLGLADVAFGAALLRGGPSGL